MKYGCPYRYYSWYKNFVYKMTLREMQIRLREKNLGSTTYMVLIKRFREEKLNRSLQIIGAAYLLRNWGSFGCKMEALEYSTDQAEIYRRYFSVNGKLLSKYLRVYFIWKANICSRSPWNKLSEKKLKLR